MLSWSIMKAGRIESFWAPDSSPALQGNGGSWGWGSRQSFQHTPCAPALSRVGCPWGRLSLDRKHSSRQKSGSPCSSLTRYPCIPFSLLALGNFLKASGPDSWLCKLLMEQDPDITNRNSGLAGWCCSLFDPATAVGMSACPSSCHLSWQFAPLSHYLLVLTFIVKKKIQRGFPNKQQVRTDSVYSQLGQAEHIATDRDLSQLRIWESCSFAEVN